MQQHADCTAQVRCLLSMDVLRRFGEVRLRVSGISMLPSLWPGDIVTVQKRHLSQVRVGEIALFTRENRLFIAHRVVDRRASLLVTRGDALLADDFPIRPQQLLGVVTAIQRGRKHFQPPQRLNRGEQLAAAILRSSWMLRRFIPPLVTAWNA